MNISYNWLKQYIDLQTSPEETAEKLTSLGLEVGTVERIQTIKGGLEGLVVAQVLTCEDHPNSDHLHITTVDFGGDAPAQVVCGAPNCRAGLKTIMATLGTTLYDGEESFTIKKSKIRGVESFGMLCAEDEIGVGTSHDGIIELPDDAAVGTPAKEWYHIEDDALIEVDITPNRADAVSHIGVARDLCAAWGLPLNRPSVKAFGIDNRNFEIEVEVADPKRCLRYSGVTIEGVTVKESPDWLKNRLLAIGQRPINNIVDITNFIINEIGQPLHAFDGDKITGNKIVVRTMPEGTPFVTLDGVERKLSAEDLVICNAEAPMCLAGVFGGLDSGVTESTTKVFIESAYFDPVSIRKTARRHGLNTDASFRYERGCDPNITVYALKRAALLIKEVAGGTISSEVTDLYPSPIPHFEVSVTYDKINRLIGMKIAPETVKKIVTGLEMEIKREDADGLELLIPPYRVDVQRDVDVIEDILRVYGYNQVPFSEHVQSAISYANKPDSTRLQNLLSNHLTGAGFNEILNNSLTKVSYYSALETFPESQAVRIMNPLGSDLSVMRQTLLFGGLETIARNRNRKQTDLRLYEFGFCYHFNAEKANPEKPLSRYREELHLGIWLSGSGNANCWTDAERPHTFFDLKAHVLNCLTRMGVPFAACKTEVFQSDLYNQAMRIVVKKSGKTLATLGIVSANIRKSFDIDADVFYADLEWNNILKAIGAHQITYSDIAKFPAVKRDLALLIDKEVTFEQIEQVAYDTDKKLLRNVVLFDVYEGKNLPAGKKSYAVSFTLQDDEKTLEDKQTDALMNRLIKAFETKLGATIR